MDSTSFSFVESTKTQKFPSAEFCILVLNHDPTSHSIITRMLQASEYEVVHYEKAANALEAIRNRKARLDLVVTDVNLPHEFDKSVLLKHIEKYSKLPIVLMPVEDYEQIVAESLNCGVALYIVKSWSKNDFQNLLGHVFEVRKGGLVERTSSLNAVAQYHEGTLRKESSEHNKDEAEDSNPRKRKTQRLKWTEELKGKFLEAIKELEDDQEEAFPSKILDRMNIPGLKRLHVASHLQRYRRHLKRVPEEKQATTSKMDLNWTTDDVNIPWLFSLLENAPTNFSTPEGNLEWPCWEQQIPPAFSGNTSSFHASPQGNTNYLNFGAVLHAFQSTNFQNESAFSDSGSADLLPSSSNKHTCFGSQMTSDGNSVRHGQMIHNDENSGNKISGESSQVMVDSVPQQFTSLPQPPPLQHDSNVFGAEDFDFGYNIQKLMSSDFDDTLKSPDQSLTQSEDAEAFINSTVDFSTFSNDGGG